MLVASSGSDMEVSMTLSEVIGDSAVPRPVPGRLPTSFYEELVSWISGNSRSERRRFTCSYLEFVFMYAFVTSGRFPFQEVGGRREMKRVQDLFVRPTITSMVDLVKVAFSDLCFQFGLDVVPVPSGVLLGLGVHTPMVGVPLELDISLIDHGRRLLQRCIRRAADLARPFTET